MTGKVICDVRLSRPFGSAGRVERADGDVPVFSELEMNSDRVDRGVSFLFAGAWRARHVKVDTHAGASPSRFQDHTFALPTVVSVPVTL
jgi:hypothetical protein